MSFRGYRTGSRTTLHHVVLPARSRGSGARSVSRNLGLYGVAERRWLRLASEGVVLVQRRSPLGSKPRAVVALRGALAPSICPVPWYSDCRERAFSGLVRSRFLGGS